MSAMQGLWGKPFIPIDFFQCQWACLGHVCILYIYECKSWHKHAVVPTVLVIFYHQNVTIYVLFSNISICKVWILVKSVEIDRIHCVRFRSDQQRMIFYKVSVWYIKTHISVTNRHCAHKIVWFYQNFMGILRQCVIIRANTGEKYQNWYEKSRICVFQKYTTKLSPKQH